jgi:hypothetical protein
VRQTLGEPPSFADNRHWNQVYVDEFGASHNMPRPVGFNANPAEVSQVDDAGMQSTIYRKEKTSEKMRKAIEQTTKAMKARSGNVERITQAREQADVAIYGADASASAVTPRTPAVTPEAAQRYRVRDHELARRHERNDLFTGQTGYTVVAINRDGNPVRV